jgi:hypothetical protein
MSNNAAIRMQNLAASLPADTMNALRKNVIISQPIEFRLHARTDTVGIVLQKHRP